MNLEEAPQMGKRLEDKLHKEQEMSKQSLKGFLGLKKLVCSTVTIKIDFITRLFLQDSLQNNNNNNNNDTQFL